MNTTNITIPTGKIFIVGAGHVGSHAAYALAAEGLVGEIALYDIDHAKANAQAEDIADAVTYLRSRTKIVAAENFSTAKNADVLVVAAGPLPDISAGETDRAQSLDRTLAVFDDILSQIKNSGFDGIILNISNPADVITQYLQVKLNWAPAKIFSTSTTLDSARLRRILAGTLGVAQQSVSALILGEHGEAQFPAWSQTSIGGEPLYHFLKRNAARLGNVDLDAIAERSRGTGWRILGGKGSTEFGIGISIVEVLRAVFRDEKRVLPISVLLEGQYGQRDVFASVPAIVGGNGIEAILELPLNKSELDLLAIACDKIRNFVQKSLTHKQ